MQILRKEVKENTKKKFEDELQGEVKIIYFTQEPRRLIVPEHLRAQECFFCKETRELLEEVSSLSPKLELIIYDFEADREKANEYKIDKIPATLLAGKEDSRIRFFGIPSGYEYTSLIEAIIDVSKEETSLGEKTKKILRSIKKNIHLEVFVTPTCPYCTLSVRLSHQFALESKHIRADMIESTEFPHLVQKYGVFAVPKTVINEKAFVEGAVSEEVFLDHILKAIS